MKKITLLLTLSLLTPLINAQSWDDHLKKLENGDLTELDRFIEEAKKKKIFPMDLPGDTSVLGIHRDGKIINIDISMDKIPLDKVDEKRKREIFQNFRDYFKPLAEKEFRRDICTKPMYSKLLPRGYIANTNIYLNKEHYVLTVPTTDKDCKELFKEIGR